MLYFTTMKLAVALLLSATIYQQANAAGVDDQIAILLKQHSPLLSYPTDYTRDIVPKAIHSHNDCKADPYMQIPPSTYHP